MIDIIDMWQFLTKTIIDCQELWQFLFCAFNIDGESTKHQRGNINSWLFCYRPFARRKEMLAKLDEWGLILCDCHIQ